MSELFQSSEFLETYIESAPSDQNAIDMFKGGWSSKFPEDHSSLVAGNTPLFSDDRIQWAINELGGVTGFKVLELGPLEGAHSYMMEKAGADSILSIEASTIAYLKCLITKEITDLKRVRFQYGNFVEFLRNNEEKFDLIMASGVLYHLVHPVESIHLMSEISDRIFIWTHYYDKSVDSDNIKVDCFRDEGQFQYEGFKYNMFRLEYDQYLPSLKYRGGLKPYTHWMNREDILACLNYFGFDDIRIGMETREHPFGPNMALLASRSS